MSLRRRDVLAGAVTASVLGAESAIAAGSDVDTRFLRLLGRDVGKPQPIGDYVPARRVGSLVFLSTTPAKVGSTITFPGIVGRDLDVAQGALSARWAVLTLLEDLWTELGGTLKPVRQFVSLTGYVASAEGFTEQAEVMNGASAVLVQLFGAERARPTRSSIGVRAMPHNASVGVSAIVEVARRPGR
jgi:enamine deaminase RidA (YjgF/YER057c/UK114 family)